MITKLASDIFEKQAYMPPEVRKAYIDNPEFRKALYSLNVENEWKIPPSAMKNIKAKFNIQEPVVPTMSSSRLHSKKPEYSDFEDMARAQKNRRTKFYNDRRNNVKMGKPTASSINKFRMGAIGLGLTGAAYGGYKLYDYYKNRNKKAA